MGFTVILAATLAINGVMALMGKANFAWWHLGTLAISLVMSLEVMASYCLVDNPTVILGDKIHSLKWSNIRTDSICDAFMENGNIQKYKTIPIIGFQDLGAELAASWMSWDNVFHCEIQDFQRKVLEYWFPNSISYEDITKTDFSEWRGRIDVLTGGFPCQPFSVAGKRKGAEDNRYLWAEMLRAIRQIQPTWVVGENVAGLLSMVQPGKAIKVGRADDLFDENFIYRTEQQFTIDAICEDLEHTGYSVQPFVIPACSVGAPHRRDRVWIVAYRTDTRAEGLQQGGQNGISKSSIAANTNSNRQGNRKDKQIFEQKCNRTTNIGKGCKDATSSNTQCFGGHKVDNKIQYEQSNGERTDGNGLFGVAVDTDAQRRFTFGDDDASIEETQQAESQFGRADCPQSWWRNFPTQSPVCNRDDGLPFRVADLTLSLPKWRRKSIEALGNAWVPQVAYEIFKAIEDYNKRKRFVAEIMVDTKRYRFRSTNYENVVWWRKMMVEKFPEYGCGKETGHSAQVPRKKSLF